MAQAHQQVFRADRLRVVSDQQGACGRGRGLQRLAWQGMPWVQPGSGSGEGAL
jgi:hypothetical protein